MHYSFIRAQRYVSTCRKKKKLLLLLLLLLLLSSTYKKAARRKWVEDWVGEVTRLAEFARSQPQASYAAFTFGLRHRWTYFMRTLPDVENLLQPLERAISDVLIPSLIGRNCSEAERDLVALPVRMRSWALKSI